MKKFLLSYILLGLFSISSNASLMVGKEAIGESATLNKTVCKIEKFNSAHTLQLGVTLNEVVYGDLVATVKDVSLETGVMTLMMQGAVYDGRFDQSGVSHYKGLKIALGQEFTDAGDHWVECSASVLEVI